MRASCAAPRRCALFVCALIAVALAPVPASATAGSVLDPTFGNNGIVTLPGSDLASRPPLAVAGDGSIWVLNHETELLHLSSRGNPLSVRSLYTAAWQLAGQPDGGVVAVGGPQLQPNRLIVLHFSANSDLDGRYFNGALDLAPFGLTWNGASLLQPDGALLLALSSNVPDSSFALVRLRPDGALDANFGDAGVVRGSFAMVPSTLTALAGGTFVLAGTTNSGDRLAKFKADGTLDMTFGTEGIADGPTALVDPQVQPDGKLVGGASDVTPQPGLRRLLPNGTLDASFGSNGTVSIAGFASARTSNVVLRPDGLIVAMGRGDNGSRNQALFIALVDANGTPVTSFGTSGVAPNVVTLGPGYVGTGTRLHCDDTVAGEVFAPSDVVFRVALPAAPPSAGQGGYVLDPLGGLHPFAFPGAVVPPPACISTPGFSRFAAARGVVVPPDATGAVVLDAWGGLHGYSTTGTVPTVVGTTSWPGWDIARALTVTTNGTGGYVLDGWGGLHPFGYESIAAPQQPTPSAYWRGWDIARGVTTLPDNSGGYVLDGWGGLHPFAVAGHIEPGAATATSYFPGHDIARAVVILHSGTGGYVLDGWGGLHPFGVGGRAAPPAVDAQAYWPGWDIARGIVVLPDDSGGYVVDGFGGMHPFAIGAHQPPAPVSGGVYWTAGIAQQAAPAL